MGELQQHLDDLFRINRNKLVEEIYKFIIIPLVCQNKWNYKLQESLYSAYKKPNIVITHLACSQEENFLSLGNVMSGNDLYSIMIEIFDSYDQSLLNQRTSEFHHYFREFRSILDSLYESNDLMFSKFSEQLAEINLKNIEKYEN